jgi:ABC-2 type transport system ATP-binding protein
VTQIRASKLPADAIKEIEAIAMKYGAKVHEIGQPTNTLEELFLKVIRESAARPGQRFVNPSAN